MFVKKQSQLHMYASHAMAQEAPIKIYARGVVSYFHFSRAPRSRALKTRQINSAILKVPDGAWSC
jgi:hypothetical protein